jgi:opacity protein-like surface antigen
MKCTIKSLAGQSLFAFIGLLTSVSYAQPGLYVRGDLGGNLTQSTGLKEFFGPVNPGSRVEFDPGVRFGVAVGYQFTDWFSLEGQTGFMANNISSITDATRLDAQYANVPFLANVRLQLPCHCRVTPYIGAGAGGSTTILDSEHIELNDVGIHGSTADFVFAWQAFGGLRYQINDRMAVSVEYHYFRADGAEFHADFAFGTDTDRIRMEGTTTHGISAAFEYKF